MKTKMKITVVGCGRVGSQLGRALREAGHEVTMVHGKNPTPCPSPKGRGDIIIISVKDDVLAEVSEKVCAGCGDALVVHTAGSMAMDVLPAAHRGVLYPMQTFSHERQVDFAEVPLFVEAAAESDLQLIEELARSLSRRVVRLGSDGRRRLHLAAVFACNFVNHCVHLASRELEPIGLDHTVLLPLMEETVRKLHSLSPREAQTGPAIRGDKGVMREHENMITDSATREIYRMMSESIGRM